MYNFRTDLADERSDIYKKANKIEEIPGIITEEQKVDEKIKITRVKIQSQEGAESLGKPIGNYITIDIKKLNILTEEEIEKVNILVVGLGYEAVTPDALGP